jgi:phenylacetate-CoA ligase
LDSRCPCGRSFDRFDQVEGIRKQEYVVGVHGSRMTLAALNMHGDLFSQVVRYQYYQDRPGRVEVRLTVTPLFGEAELQALARGFRAKVGDELEVRLSIVEEIPLTVRGKLRRLVQAIPTENADLPRDQHSEA